MGIVTPGAVSATIGTSGVVFAATDAPALGQVGAVAADPGRRVRTRSWNCRGRRGSRVRCRPAGGRGRRDVGFGG